MSVHRFPIGQSVRLKSRQGLSPRAADTYRIIALLPVRDNSPQYRMRNDEVSQERVSQERDIEAYDIAPDIAAE
ncbi:MULTISPECIES: hypothetical protein [Rhizobium]|uniref:Uncharacterized protein n=1 Tax=Rhizobium rhododendri TaxID=2506430 RepID=A0ABY8IKD5_9HYPH|nr:MULTISPECIES: hypothetical protein [Rhizobium]MBO9097746.1 hypothetical protein [Rhizobium sp. L58/93]MBO9133471.1 hypothetical protein [Rhizobium sp. B209b/85]MBO9167896.1 hypothetical protein [Rhizobium sp. L245/93]MBO9183941.1 hypothetical protein [Rhizobium sp. E27B/91]MBZ5761633.1 hypothetical protein [Rhizobium sp. VS19-DR96]